MCFFEFNTIIYVVVLFCNSIHILAYICDLTTYTFTFFAMDLKLYILKLLSTVAGCLTAEGLALSVVSLK